MRFTTRISMFDKSQWPTEKKIISKKGTYIYISEISRGLYFLPKLSFIRSQEKKIENQVEITHHNYILHYSSITSDLAKAREKSGHFRTRAHIVFTQHVQSRRRHTWVYQTFVA